MIPPFLRGNLCFSEVTELQKRRRRTGKYTGYIRITVFAVSIILLILIIYSLRKPKDDAGNITVTVIDSGEESVPQGDEEVPETESSDVEIPYEKKKVDNADYRAVVKLRSDLGIGNLIMVNRENTYKFADISANLVPVSSGIGTNKAFKVSYNTLKLQKTALEAFSSMMDDFYSVFSDGDVTVVNAFVSYADQNANYQPVSGDVPFVQSENQLPPGCSDHHTGLALDLKLVNSSGNISAYDGTGNYKWINDNCYKYGFILRYPFGKDEVTGVAGYPAHLRFVGVPHSYIMHENGFTLEEYLNDLKKYVYGYEHLYYSVFGYDYEIYYEAAETTAEETLLPVPKKEDYSVSGNNCDGFVVTVCRKADGDTWQPEAQDPVPARQEVTEVTENQMNAAAAEDDPQAVTENLNAGE